MPDHYDVIVIGAGPGGEVVAGACAESGLATVVVERELVGGECSFWGCMPSKGLLRPTDVMGAAERVPGAREAITGAINAPAALQWRDEITNGWDDQHHVKWLTDRGVTVIRGSARLAGPRTVEVSRPEGTNRLTATRAVVVATGSSAAIPPIDGLRDIRIWDNRGVTEAKEVPRSLIVLGGGAIGVEMAQAWHSLGTQDVTVIEAMDRLIPAEEPFAGEMVRRAFESAGIEVITGVRMVGARREGTDGPVTARLENGRELTADEILVAVGRRPNTRELGLETVGLEPGRPIGVDDHMRAAGVEGEWLYAIGDCNGRALLTHMAKYHGRKAAAHIAGDSNAAVEEDAIPRIIFTDPQVAAVGLTEAGAQDKGIRTGVASCAFEEVAGIVVTGVNVTGRVKLVIDEDRQVLVGATFAGPDAGDMLHAATVAVVGRVPVDRLRHAVGSFPSLTEVWLKSMENYDHERKGFGGTSE